MPYLRFGITLIALFLVARLLQGLTLAAAALAASQKAMPYQRGQFWIRRFGKQAERLCAALREVREHVPTPQILLTDIVMPAMNGLALAAQVHRLLPGIRVVFMSGFVDDYRVELTGSVCLRKPFTIAQLLATVRGAETAC